jgi:hypothetical protein
MPDSPFSEDRGRERETAGENVVSGLFGLGGFAWGSAVGVSVILVLVGVGPRLCGAPLVVLLLVWWCAYKTFHHSPPSTFTWAVPSYVAFSGPVPSWSLLPDVKHSIKCNTAGVDGEAGPPNRHFCIPFTGTFVSLTPHFAPEYSSFANAPSSSGVNSTSVNDSCLESRPLVAILPVGSDGSLDLTEHFSGFVTMHDEYSILPSSANVELNGRPPKVPPVQSMPVGRLATVPVSIDNKSAPSNFGNATATVSWPKGPVPPVPHKDSVNVVPPNTQYTVSLPLFVGQDQANLPAETLLPPHSLEFHKPFVFGVSLHTLSAVGSVSAEAGVVASALRASAPSASVASSPRSCFALGMRAVCSFLCSACGRALVSRVGPRAGPRLVGV